VLLLNEQYQKQAYIPLSLSPETFGYNLLYFEYIANGVVKYLDIKFMEISI